MIEFILFTVVCLTIFLLANGIRKQTSMKTLQPIRIETKEELLKKRLLKQRQDRFKN